MKTEHSRLEGNVYFARTSVTKAHIHKCGEKWYADFFGKVLGIGPTPEAAWLAGKALSR